MRLAPMALVVLLLLPALPTARAAGATIAVELVATEIGGAPVYVDASGARNPTLHALPGDRLAIHLVNHGQLPHGITFGSPVSKGAPCCAPPGGELNFTLDLPASFEGDVRYECPLHGESGMRGILRVSFPAPDVRLATPANGTTLRGDAVARALVGNATLGQGFTLRWTLDGRLVDHSANDTFPLAGLERRNHLLQVELVNATDAVVARDESFFYVQDALTTPTPATTEGPTPPGATPTEKIPAPWLPLVVVALALAALTRSRAS